MLKTRGKRDLNLGSQPVISKVSSEPGHDGSRSMLSSDPKIRGHMINLKKIMLPCLQDKMKGFTSTLIRDNVVIFYAGMDATNLHFSNKATHTGFIELGLTVRQDQSQTDPHVRLKNAMKQLMDLILTEFNEMMTVLAGDKTCLLTREILGDCGASGEKDGKYFISAGSQERQTIDFRMNDGNQPFLELRHIQNASILFEKYGVFYMPLKMVAADIKVGMATYGTSDWAFRDTTFQQAITRGGLTLTNWTFYSLLRECFPAVTMRKMKVREAVVSMIEANIQRASLESNQADVNKLKKDLNAELDAYQNDAELERVLNFDTMFRRCVLLGYLPNHEEFQEVLNNTYNQAILREIRVVLLPQ